MKQIMVVLAVIVASADAVDAAWLLWKHTYVTRRTEGTPRGLNPDANVAKWDLLNAVDLRKECIASLKVEQKKLSDGLAKTYPGEPISESSLADGVSVTISAGAETKEGSAAKPTQLYYEYTLWCLPTGVDPRSTRPAPDRK
ncbi:MAG TPA: hypothetical protein VJQ55_07155 [Candidatus Binatia bacterium]|nr:hypothetical protein [Candidatus Binatia bacterium]